MRLEDLTPTTLVKGILPDSFVEIVKVEWHGSDTLTLVYRGPNGRVADEILYRHDESRRELKSSREENNSSRSCAMRHKTVVNIDVCACSSFSLLDGHHAPKRTKTKTFCPVLSRPRKGARGCEWVKD